MANNNIKFVFSHSFQLRLLILFAHFGAMLCILPLMLPWLVKIILLLICCVSLYFCENDFHFYAQRIVFWHVNENEWHLILNNVEYDAILCVPLFVANNLIILRFKIIANSRKINLVILRDSLAAESMRKLKVLLKTT